jgi:hypothetical protein
VSRGTKHDNGDVVVDDDDDNSVDDDEIYLQH